MDLRSCSLLLFLFFFSSTTWAQDSFDIAMRRRDEQILRTAATEARATCDPMATAQPPPGGWTGWEEDDINVSNFTCNVGFADWCTNLNWDETGRAMLDREERECTTTHHFTPLRDLNRFMVGPYADTTFFQELANRTVTATTCQLRVLEPSQRQPLVNAGANMFEQMQPLFQIMVRERSRLYQEKRSLDFGAADPRTGGDFRRRQAALQEQIDGINNSIDQLIAQMPFGSQEPVKNALHGMAGRAASTAQIRAAYNRALTEVRTSFEDASCTYQRIRNPRSGVYRLDQSQKIALYNSPGAADLIRRIDPDGDRLGCQLRRCYVNGPRNEQFVAIAALLGLTVLSAGTASPFVGAVATLGSVAFSATQIENACRRPTITATAQSTEQCTASSMAQLTVSQTTYTGCAIEVALGSLDLIPGVIEARNLLRARRLAQASEIARAEEAARLASAAGRTDAILAGTIRVGGEAAADGGILVTGSATRAQRATQLAGRLERGEDAASLFERLGYSRVTDPPAGTVAFRNARGEEIIFSAGQRFSAREADRVKDILERGRGSYTGPGVTREVASVSARGQTLAEQLGGSARAEIIARAQVTSAESLDEALLELYRLRPGQAEVAELTAAQRLTMIDELERGLRIRDPRLLQSPEYLAYKQRLQTDLVAFTAQASEDAENLALRLQDELTRISPAERLADDYQLVIQGRAEEVIARTPGIAAEDAARLRALEERIAEARGAIDEIPGASVPDSIRLADDVPVPGRPRAGVAGEAPPGPAVATVVDDVPAPAGAGRGAAAAEGEFDLAGSTLPRSQIEDARKLGLDDTLRVAGEDSGFYSRIENPAVNAAEERRLTLNHIAERFAAWDRIDPNLRGQITTFLDGITDIEKKRQFSAILLNAANNNPVDALARLRRFTGLAQPPLLKEDYLQLLRDRIREIDRTATSTNTQIAQLANERSALEVEALFIERGENLSVEGIFSARAHNEVMRGAGRDPHSLDDSFNIDIRVRGEDPLPLCRGSGATEGLASGITGGFFKPGCTPNFLDRGTNGRTAATPRDATDVETLQGYSRMNALEFEADRRITIGRNGDVRYDSAKGEVYQGTGGPGGDLEAFPSRLGEAPSLGSLRGSTRLPTCSQQYSQVCREIFSIQERITTRGLGPDAVSVLEAELRNVQGILNGFGDEASRAVRDIDNLGVVDNLNGLNRAHPDLLSALKVEHEIQLKLDIARGNPRGYPRGSFPMDAETRAYQLSAQESSLVQGQIQRSLSSTGSEGFSAIRSRVNQLLNSVEETNTVTSFRQSMRTVQDEINRLEGATRVADPVGELRRLNNAAAVADDMYLGIRGMRGELVSRIERLRNITDAQKSELIQLVNRRMPSFPRRQTGVLMAPAD